jgi:acetyl esterase
MTELDSRLTDADSAAFVRDANALFLAHGFPTRRAMGVERVRALARERIAARPAPNDPDLAVRDLSLDTDAGLAPVREYRRVAEPRTGVVLYLHGGGWVSGDLDINDSVCRQLCRDTGLRVVSHDYPLAPEYPYPAALDAAAALLRALSAAQEPTDPMLVAGLSAGGALAAALADRAGHGAAPRVDQLLLISPVTDCDLTRDSYQRYGDGLMLTADDMAWFWEHYLADERAREHPDASPLRTRHAATLPPTTVVVSGADPLRDEGIAYAELLAAHGVDVTLDLVEGVHHGFPASDFASARESMARTTARINQLLS